MRDWRRWAFPPEGEGRTYAEWRETHPVAAEVWRSIRFLALFAAVALIVWGFARGDSNAAQKHPKGYVDPGYLSYGITPVWVTVDGRRIRCLVTSTESYSGGMGISCDWRRP